MEIKQKVSNFLKILAICAHHAGWKSFYIDLTYRNVLEKGLLQYKKETWISAYNNYIPIQLVFQEGKTPWKPFPFMCRDSGWKTTSSQFKSTQI